MAEFKSELELIEKAKQAIGHCIQEYDVNDRMSNEKSKGKIGQVMEEGFFGYEVNSRQEADFVNLGIELKVFGYKWVNNNKRVSSKERLILTMINYLEDINFDFFSSNCYHKLDKIMMLLYEYEKGKSEREFIISNYYLYKFLKIPEKDQKIIFDDWKFIINKIKEGKAHELSEADTVYLGAAPKGANSSSVTTQPFNDELAMKRAYSLKSSYMTSLLRQKIFKEVDNRESFLKDMQLLKGKTFSEIVLDKFKQYEGKTLSDIDLATNVKINRVNKSYLSRYTARMLEVGDKNLNSLEEFQNANIIVKTIRVSRNGKVKESMSFPAFQFTDVVDEDWQSSYMRELFESQKYLFVIFDEVDDVKKEYKFRIAKFWNMPQQDLDSEVRRAWAATKYILLNELEIRIKNGIIYNNFPCSIENTVTHVRPHGKNRMDTYSLPKSCSISVLENDGSVSIDYYLREHLFSKMCFWLNRDYILKIVNSN